MKFKRAGNFEVNHLNCVVVSRIKNVPALKDKKGHVTISAYKEHVEPQEFWRISEDKKELKWFRRQYYEQTDRDSIIGGKSHKDMTEYIDTAMRLAFHRVSFSGETCNIEIDVPALKKHEKEVKRSMKRAAGQLIIVDPMCRCHSPEITDALRYALGKGYIYATRIEHPVKHTQDEFIEQVRKNYIIAIGSGYAAGSGGGIHQ